MDPNVILGIINGVLIIIARHQQNNPGAPPLTPEEVHLELQAELADGESDIVAWFAEKGLEPPA